MVLSIGGGVAGYKLENYADGVALAEFLWGAYGPYKKSWTDAGKPRPLDLGYYNNDTTKRIDIDGFDFDIEFLGPGESLDTIEPMHANRNRSPTRLYRMYYHSPPTVYTES
jgi:hypothetical protein